jgi:hypothetical protein
MVAGLTALLLASVGPLAHATDGYYDGYSLRELCQGQERADRATNPVERGRGWGDAAECEGYIKGVWDGLAIAGIFSGDNLNCVPNIREGQVQILVRRYLEAHPERLHFAAPTLITAALTDAFHCERAR